MLFQSYKCHYTCHSTCDLGGVATLHVDDMVGSLQSICGLICSIMRCMTPLGVKGHIKVRVRVRVGISESHYEQIKHILQGF